VQTCDVELVCNCLVIHEVLFYKQLLHLLSSRHLILLHNLQIPHKYILYDMSSILIDNLDTIPSTPGVLVTITIFSQLPFLLQ
jgi:hypothetical protein